MRWYLIAAVVGWLLTFVFVSFFGGGLGGFNPQAVKPADSVDAVQVIVDEAVRKALARRAVAAGSPSIDGSPSKSAEKAASAADESALHDLVDAAVKKVVSQWLTGFPQPPAPPAATQSKQAVQVLVDAAVKESWARWVASRPPAPDGGVPMPPAATKKSRRHVITLTTSPKRLRELHKLWGSFAHADEVVLNIPKRFRNEEEYDPGLLAEIGVGMKIIVRDQDEGPGMKFSALADICQSADDYVTTVCEDRMHPFNVAHALQRHHERLPRGFENAVLCVRGQPYDFWKAIPAPSYEVPLQGGEPHLWHIQVPETFASCTMTCHPDTVKSVELSRFLFNLPACRLSDDMVWGLALEHYKVPVVGWRDGDKTPTDVRSVNNPELVSVSAAGGVSNTDKYPPCYRNVRIALDNGYPMLTSPGIVAAIESAAQAMSTGPSAAGNAADATVRDAARNVRAALRCNGENNTAAHDEAFLTQHCPPPTFSLLTAEQRAAGMTDTTAGALHVLNKSEHGFFVEFPVGDPIGDSQTLHLETQKTWHGVLVEADASRLMAIVTHRGVAVLLADLRQKQPSTTVTSVAAAMGRTRVDLLSLRCAAFEDSVAVLRDKTGSVSIGVAAIHLPAPASYATFATSLRSLSRFTVAGATPEKCRDDPSTPCTAVYLVPTRTS